MDSGLAPACMKHAPGRNTIVVLLGIDGSGKTTAARSLKDLFPSTPVLVLRNYSGRKTIAGWACVTGSVSLAGLWMRWKRPSGWSTS